jgi:hypothetical protein
MTNVPPRHGPSEDTNTEQPPVITIRHTRTDGTLVLGTRRNDGSGKILKRSGFRPSRRLPDDAYWYVPHSRDRNAKTWVVDQAADALRNAGFEVQIDIDNTSPSEVSFADREAERYERAEDRADRYGDRADRASGAGTRMWEDVREQRSQIPLGQPMMPDHHSYRADRNRRERWHRKEDRAIQEMRRGEYWAGRQQAAEKYRKHREDIPTTLRRIKKLEARQRQIDRELEGRAEWHPAAEADERIAALAERGITARKIAHDEQYGVLVHIPVVETYKAELDAETAQLTDELEYWRAHVEQAKAEGVKVWSRDDFVKGDFIRTHLGVWLEVVRVNKRSVTVPWIIHAVGADVYTWVDEKHRSSGDPYTDTVPYDKIRDKATATEIRQRFPAAFAKNIDNSPQQDPHED